MINMWYMAFSLYCWTASTVQYMVIFVIVYIWGEPEKAKFYFSSSSTQQEGGNLLQTQRTLSLVNHELYKRC